MEARGSCHGRDNREGTALAAFIRRRQFRYNPEWLPALAQCSVVDPLAARSNLFRAPAVLNVAVPTLDRRVTPLACTHPPYPPQLLPLRGPLPLASARVDNDPTNG
jgi:hypothetical protein